tara:strand:+ start:92 stop:409 length:318 start_codon:yes stop_codon:yes gene_type:complete
MVIEAVKSTYKPTGRFILILFGYIWMKISTLFQNFQAKLKYGKRQQIYSKQWTLYHWRIFTVMGGETNYRTLKLSLIHNGLKKDLTRLKNKCSFDTDITVPLAKN